MEGAPSGMASIVAACWLRSISHGRRHVDKSCMPQIHTWCRVSFATHRRGINSETCCAPRVREGGPRGDNDPNLRSTDKLIITNIPPPNALLWKPQCFCSCWCQRVEDIVGVVQEAYVPLISFILLSEADRTSVCFVTSTCQLSKSADVQFEIDFCSH